MYIQRDMFSKNSTEIFTDSISIQYCNNTINQPTCRGVHPIWAVGLARLHHRLPGLLRHGDVEPPVGDDFNEGLKNRIIDYNH
jgi:hypothetical protein